MSHRILIMDEQDESRRALNLYLGRALGYMVTAVEEAAPALELAMAEEFDLAIISTALEGVSGIEAYMRLRSLRPDIQAIFFLGEKPLSETDRDYLRFSIPEEQVIERPTADLSTLTRLIVGILGPPVH